ncbi:MAG: Endoglucanase, partial [Flavipsychrobacter sp.]|nr:Endoglucanase [Flavipsychrobacter sp.]
MNTFLRYGIFLFTLLTCSVAAIAQQKGEIVYSNNFDSEADMQGWDGRYRLVTKDGNSALLVRSDNKPTVLLPVEKLRGATLKIKARIKAQKVSTPPRPWNGIKVMLHSVLPWTDEYPQMPVSSGSFDWRESEFLAFISPSVDTVRLVVGLEEVTGRVWYDRIEISIFDPPQPLHKAAPATAVYKGHDEPRLRGMMIPTFAGP